MPLYLPVATVLFETHYINISIVAWPFSLILYKEQCVQLILRKQLECKKFELKWQVNVTLEA